MIGIYIIKNVVNNKHYIGSSNNIYDRWRRHKRALLTNSHHSVALQRAWNKYGARSFTFGLYKVLDENISNEDLRKEEQKYLDSKASIDAWFRDNIIKDDTKKILRSELYNNYKEYCEDNDVLLMKKADLFESMNDIMGHTKKLHGLIYYIGYDFKPNEDEEQIKKYSLDL